MVAVAGIAITGVTGGTGTRFTRVTIIGPRRRLDISLPAQAPLIESLPTLLKMLSMPVSATPTAWRLAATELGSIDLSRSLDDIGVLDGRQLYLVEAAGAPPPPFVDDVESAVAESVGDSSPSWTGAGRRGVIGVLLGAVLLAGVSCGWTAALPINWIAPLAALLGAVAAGWAIRESGGWACALVIPPAAVTLLVAVAADASTQIGAEHRVGLPKLLLGNGFPLVAGLVAGLALSIVGLVRRAPAVGLTGQVASVGAAGGLMCSGLGLPPDRVAGVALLVAVALTGFAGQVGVGRAGVVDLMVADERGQPISRKDVHSAVRRGLGVVTGMVWGAAAIAATAACLLTAGPGTVGSTVVGVLGGAIFGLRSRMFSRVMHVAPMLCVAVVVAVCLALRAPFGPAAGSTWLTPSLLAVCAVGVCCGLVELPDVAAARLQRALDRLELATTLALVPGLVVLFGVVPAVLGWWH